jgi:hypothetical protein
MRDSGGNDAILLKAAKDLVEAWSRTEANWHDSARADFERDFLTELAPAVATAAGAVQRIEEVLARARKECS